MKKFIAFLLIIAMMNSFVCFSDAVDSDKMEIIIEDDGQSHEDELDIEMDASEVEGIDELLLDDILMEDLDMTELETDADIVENDSTQPKYPIVIGNINGTEAKFYESLERYITNTDSDEYNPGLAHMLVALAGAAYNEKIENGRSGLLTPENAGYQSESKELKHITKAYEDLGFNDYQVFNYYNNPDDPAYGADNVAFSIGMKQPSDDDALVLIVVRGSYGDLPDFKKKDLTVSSDWQSNFKINTNSKGRHLGFARAADKVYSALKSFLIDRQYSDAAMKSNLRYVITGHSRGAAVANLLAVKLHDEKIPNSRVYDYNFACPDTVRGFKLSNLKKNHENIFNICNSADAVSVIPGIIGDGLSDVGYIVFHNTIREKYKDLFLSWGKYGTTWFYCKNWNDPKEFDLTRTFIDIKNSPHDTKFYIPDIGKNTYKFYSWSNIVARGIKLGVQNLFDDIINVLYPKYVISPKDIINAKVIVDDQVFTGKPIKPAVSVKLNEKTLINGSDYTITYENNKNIGTASVIVKGKGDYTGAVKVFFCINPKAVTGFTVSAGNKQIIANWKKMTEVTGYQVQYGVKKDFSSAKIVTIKKNTTIKKIIKDLTAGETYYMRIRAYKTVNKKKYYSAWSGVKKAVVQESSATGIHIDGDHFPDETFRTYVQDYADKDSNGVLTDDECSAVKGISVPQRNIESLKGIEYFTELEYLDCAYNKITTLDLSSNNHLISLHCGANYLELLDVKNNTELVNLGCGGNKLLTIDVSQNTLLESLYCEWNELRSLDLSHNQLLDELYCLGNPLEKLDLSHNPELKTIWCFDCSLTSIDFSHNTAIQRIDCNDNSQLTSINIKGCKNLQELTCFRCKLASIDVSDCVALEMLDCFDNQLTELRFGVNKELSNLKCYFNKLKEINVSNCPNIVACIKEGKVQTKNTVIHYYLNDDSITVDSNVNLIL